MSSTDTPLAVPDGGSQASYLTVANMAGVIADLNVRLTVHHPATSQLIGVLVAPDGTSIVLMSHNGEPAGDFLNTTFDAQAATPIAQGTAPFLGSYRPVGDLSSLASTNPNGVWRLIVGGPGSAVLENWSLEITTNSPEPSTTSDPDGQYSLPFALSGVHNVRQQPPADVHPNTPADGVYSLDVPAGLVATERDFGDVGSSIAGRVYRDTHDYGVLNPDEAGLPGVTVYDDLNGDGVLNTSPIIASYASTDVPLPIVDNQTTTSLINVDAVPSPILDVNVHLTLTHTYDADLVMTLVAPDGTSVILAQNNGGSSDDYVNTVFDDQATTPIGSGAAPFTGSFRPITPLAALVGKSAGGTWTLRVEDQADADVGSLAGWSLDVEYDAVEPSVVSGPDGTYLFPYVVQGPHSIRVAVPNGASLTAPAGQSNNVAVSGYTEAVDQNFGLAFASSIVNRFVFYNNSSYDGLNPNADGLDDAAIATDKTPYRLGDGSAGPQNATSYARGINGIIVDVFDGSTITAGDFSFKVGTNNVPDTWAPAPAPSAVLVRAGEGVAGGDRVEILWADGAIANTWLQVTLRGNDAAADSTRTPAWPRATSFTSATSSATRFWARLPPALVTNAADEIGVRTHSNFDVPSHQHLRFQ